MIQAIPRPVRVAAYLYRFKDLEPSEVFHCTQEGWKAATKFPLHLYHLNQIVEAENESADSSIFAVAQETAKQEPEPAQ